MHFYAAIDVVIRGEWRKLGNSSRGVIMNQNFSQCEEVGKKSSKKT